MSMRGNPFEELDRMVERLSKQFEEASDEWGSTWQMPGLEDVSVDVEDRNDEIVVTADLPGFEKDDIDVRLANNQLRIRADREESSETSEEGEYIRRERSHRSMNRSIQLPESIDEETVSARYKNGVLTVTMQKTTPTKGKSIDIS